MQIASPIATGLKSKKKPAAKPAEQHAPKASAHASKGKAAQEEKDWTVLCYMDGHNDLEPFVTQSMLELEQVGSDDNVNVVAQLGRLSQDKLKEVREEREQEYEATNIDGDWSGVRRYLVEGNPDAKKSMDLEAILKDLAAGKAEKEEEAPAIRSKVLQDLGEVDMSKGTSLADFLAWGMKNYPAKHYLVSLFDHGGGWRGAFTDDASGGGGKIMEASEIATALRLAQAANGGKKIDNVDMVACLMASHEMAHQMKDSAKYLTASEEMGTTEAFHYGPIIEELQAASAEGKSLQPKELAEFLVHHYDDKPEAFVTKSAIDLEQIDGVTQAVDGLAKALNATKTKAEDLKSAMLGAQEMARVEVYPFYDQFRDLYGVAEQLDKSEDVKDEAVKKAARKVMKAVDGAVVANLAHEYQRQEVLTQGYSQNGKEVETVVKLSNGQFDTHGLTIYSPIDKKFVSDKLMEPYRQLELSKETGWDEFITKLNEDKTKHTKEASKTNPATPPDLDQKEQK